MRKHDVRKWLHAILDLLPVILIPVFMIYSHRHQIDNYSIVRKEDVYYESNIVEDYNDIKVDNIYYWNDSVTQGEFDTYVEFGIYCNIDLFKSQFSLYEDANISRVSLYLDTSLAIYYAVDVVDVGQRYVNLTDIPNYFIPIGFNNKQNISNQVCSHIKYTDYKYFEGYLDVVYDDTDIGSQMFYCLYNSVDKYFNMGNVFHLEEVYQWFNVNIFGGNSPLSIYVVYNIVIYELVMDLLFLLYSLFMWFIDMITKLMEKPLNSIK